MKGFERAMTNEAGSHMELPSFRRTRRTRRTTAIRAFVRECSLVVEDLVYPLFVTHGAGIHREIPSMPGQFQISLDALAAEMDELVNLHIPAVLLFGIPEHKDAHASGAFADDGIVQQAIRVIKASAPDVLVIADVCACEYTNHGHCGILVGEEIDNDQTLDLLSRTAISLADAGADVIAPSDMMDGRIAVLRRALDRSGHIHVPLMSYAAKYASAFYGPFRDAAGSAPAFGDRRSHQMDPANGREAMREIAIDIEEGADLIIIKPALSYLDILREARERFDVPMVAYNVSGEYAMVKAAARAGWIDERRIVGEMLLSMKRAGADRVITYFAKDVARWLRAESTSQAVGTPAAAQ
jgi:porphobilinogen synthase